MSKSYARIEQFTHTWAKRKGILNTPVFETQFTTFIPSFLFLLIVAGSVKIAKSKVVVLEGTSVSVHCNFSGFHSQNVSWISASNHTVETGSILKFPNISRRYDGQYNCSASNVCGVDSKRVYIDVQCESNCQ